MKKRLLLYLSLFLAVSGMIAGCTEKKTLLRSSRRSVEHTEDAEGSDGVDETDWNSDKITPQTEITELEEGLSVVRYQGDYGFSKFLKQGGADSDAGVAKYLSDQIMEGGLKVLFGGNPFGCSTISAANSEGGYLFGRNFDWENCQAWIVSSRPEQGYASVSTVNMDFIQAGGIDISILPDQVQAIVGLYAPLDGMNEKGLAVSVNMIQDSATISQDAGKPDLTTTTAVRLLLDQAANVEEAIELFKQYDLHASMGMMVHFALADDQGNSVVVEFIDNEMVVTKTPVVTNFYLAEGGKYGIGTEQSHTRYEILTKALKEHQTMTEAEIRDALDSVSKDNFNEYESTEWSIVMNQQTRELTYFHRENYQNGYTVSVE